jgi:hypothetical protein
MTAVKEHMSTRTPSCTRIETRILNLIFGRSITASLQAKFLIDGAVRDRSLSPWPRLHDRNATTPLRACGEGKCGTGRGWSSRYRLTGRISRNEV